jgi:hypothetical protein
MGQGEKMMVPDWKRVLRKAWSIRLMVLAGVLTGCETILPLYADSLPRGLFAVLSMAVIVLAMIARLVVQKEMRDD